MRVPVRLRTAHPDDAASLAALAERTFRASFADENAKADMDAYVQSAFSLARVQIELANPAHVFLLAATGDSSLLIGYAKLRAGEVDPSVSGPSPMELQRLYVDQAAIGTGVGAALMEASLNVARAGGYETLWLGVWEENPRAIRFYESWGFTRVGTHVFRLGSDDQLDLVMERPVELT